MKITFLDAQTLGNDLSFEELSALGEVTVYQKTAPDEITAHAKGAELDLAYASECGLPYHAGAPKYFAEKGITVQTAE